MSKKMQSKKMRSRARPHTKSHTKPQTPPRRHQKVAVHRGVPKSTSNIREAVSRRKRTKGKNFFRDFVVNRINLKKGWNFKKKTYMFGGTAKIYASVEYSSPFPIDDSAIKNNRFKMAWKRDYNEEARRDKSAIFESGYSKTVRRNLGKLTYEDAKKLFEKEMILENKKFIQMLNQFSSDNKEAGKIEKLKWFKLIVR